MLIFSVWTVFVMLGFDTNSGGVDGPSLGLPYVHSVLPLPGKRQALYVEECSVLRKSQSSLETAGGGFSAGDLNQLRL